MRIEHIAIWTLDIERLRSFYEKYFDCRAGEKYINPIKNFESYFLAFDGGARMEIMRMPLVQSRAADLGGTFVGIAHFAVSVGSRQAVISLTERLRRDGFSVVGEPRTTGDGYFESVIKDPDGNLIEITI
ncbi:lactoylglutathione lyase [Anaerosolibacter carboniphilus]|uniref:Lactoylglutathione lyase n=1 Tax=Anaerosolibacter carboniphilus TaxID=1417629 RepID=A0A841KWE3_9FIRM|nr:VOC family protein [Anaerosolibacter carboniphilus]MBB6215242.1 lactoylglutathione lyase [Anaerosolibacter carboniphilus]